MLFNCTARYVIMAWLFSGDAFFHPFARKVWWPSIGEQWGLQIHQNKGIQENGCCKIEVFLSESSQTGAAVSQTCKKKKREFLAALKISYSNAASFRRRLVFSLFCWWDSFAIAGPWWCGGPMCFILALVLHLDRPLVGSKQMLHTVWLTSNKFLTNYQITFRG